MTVAVPDRIEKTITLRAPRARVWRALTNADEFGSWFGMKFNGKFAPGAHLRGVMTPTTVDPEVASLQKPHEGMPFEITIERMEPERSNNTKLELGGGYDHIELISPGP